MDHDVLVHEAWRMANTVWWAEALCSIELPLSKLTLSIETCDIFSVFATRICVGKFNVFNVAYNLY
jgi:hypothetical protein